MITASDYAHFQEYCAYLAAKLMTIFMEYPIIFFGYSLNDPNVRIILQSIAKCLSAENLEKLQDRFIYVEWIAEKNDIEISDAAITMGDKTVKQYDHTRSCQQIHNNTVFIRWIWVLKTIL